MLIINIKLIIKEIINQYKYWLINFIVFKFFYSYNI